MPSSWLGLEGGGQPGHGSQVVRADPEHQARRYRRVACRGTHQNSWNASFIRYACAGLGPVSFNISRSNCSASRSRSCPSPDCPQSPL